MEPRGLHIHYMEICFSQRTSVKLFSPRGYQPGECLIWRSGHQFHLQEWDRLCFLPSSQLANRWGGRAYPILGEKVGKGTEHPRPCFLMIWLAYAIGRYPYKGEMHLLERNRSRGCEAVGERITRILQVITPALHKQETHRDPPKIIYPFDSNKS